MLAAPEASDRHVQTLAMVYFYHASGGSFALDHGHTVPVGRPWVPGSACDHLLVSLPYPWGPSLEDCPLPDGGHIRALWLLPITKAEWPGNHGHQILRKRRNVTLRRCRPHREKGR